MTEQEQHGLEVAERFVRDIEQRIGEIEEGLHYLKEWIRVTKAGTPSLLKITSYRPRS